MPSENAGKIIKTFVRSMTRSLGATLAEWAEVYRLVITSNPLKA